MSSMEFENRLKQAIELHEAGRVDEACAIYAELLPTEPRHPKILYLIGIAALQKGAEPKAVDYFRQSLSIEPKNLEAQFYLGVSMMNLGLMPQAIEAFEKTLQLDSQNCRAYCLLGNCLAAIGRETEAVPMYEHSMRLDQGNWEAANNLANIYKRYGRLDEAAGLYRHALGLVPNNADIVFNLSQTYQQALRFDLAVPTLRQALALRPDAADWHLRLVYALHGNGLPAEAESVCRQVLQLAPTNAEAHYLMGNFALAAGKTTEAVAAFEKAVEQRPTYVQALSNLGATHQRNGNLEEAYRWYQRVLQVEPKSPNALYNIGFLLVVNGKFDSAVSYLQRAHEAAPTHLETLEQYAFALNSLHQYDLAAQVMERMVALVPESAQAHFSLGLVYRRQNQHDLALERFRRAYELDSTAPNLLAALIGQKQTVCEWDGMDELADRYIAYVDDETPQAMDGGVAPFMVISLSKPSTGRQQLAAAVKHVRERERFYGAKPLHRITPESAGRRQRRKIRLGYISGDLQLHPVGYLVAELFESHNRDEFEVYGYSFGPGDTSLLRKRLTASFDRFRDIQHDSFEQSAARIANDEIDILVDLHGYTSNCRTEIVLMRPAPIQVNYLGYPGTMGTKAIDYILVDEFLVPPERQAEFSEKLIHLPGCFLVNDSKRDIDPKPPLRPYLGLPEEAFVFCAFNSNQKMNRSLFEVWMRLLKAVPGSVLWLRDTNHFALANLKLEAARCGVSWDRMVMAPSMSMPKHLARHRAADLFLDSFPYNQHSTAADALRMGLPLLTLTGETFVSRVAGSLLTTLGLPELITRSFEEYEEKAVQLARSPDEMTAVRRKLARNLASTDLFDGRAFARKIEVAFRSMWQDFLSRR